MADIKFVTYCMNHGYFVQDEEDPHLDAFPDHVLVEFMVTDEFVGEIGNFFPDNIITPISGTSTTTIPGFDSIEDAITYIVVSGVSAISPTSGTPTDAFEEFETLEEAIIALNDNKVSISGDTMTGYLNLNDDPVSDLQAATKRYVDDSLSSPTNKVITISFTSGGVGGDDD